MDKNLLLRFLREEATPADQAELEAWAAEDPSHGELLADLQDPDKAAEAIAKLDQLHREEAWQRVAEYSAAMRPVRDGTSDSRPAEDQTLAPRPVKVLWMNIRQWPFAAVVITLAGLGAWWIAERRSAPEPSVVVTKQLTHDVLPGGNKAVLTLSSGQKLVLDSATEDTTLREGAAIVAGSKGILAYNPGTAPVTQITYNTLTTPRGGQYQLTLPDGTKVWLNAQPSITFPTAFTEDERQVKITGEAYFEVAKDPGHGFRVLTPTAAVQDIGTSFNINSYSDETSVVTTVLSGKVRFIQGVEQHPKPDVVMLVAAGEQAKMDAKGEITGVDHPDLAGAVAWKNGLFSFTDADVPTVMRQLSRWYNVDVSYEGNIPKREFNGKIGKTLTLDQVLKGLTQARIHYSINGNQLTIRP